MELIFGWRWRSRVWTLAPWSLPRECSWDWLIPGPGSAVSQICSNLFQNNNTRESSDTSFHSLISPPTRSPRGCYQSPNKAASPHSEQLRGFVFMFLKSWGHKTCLYGVGGCSQLGLTTAIMLGRWLEVKVTRPRHSALSHCCRPTHPTLPSSSAKHHPCYLLCSQCGSLAQHTGPVRSYLYFGNHQHWGRGREEDTDGDYCFLELVVCNIQIIPTWLWGWWWLTTCWQTISLYLCTVYCDIVEVDNDNYSCCNYTLFEIRLHNSPSEASHNI